MMKLDISHCTLCPRQCGADRSPARDGAAGVCGGGAFVKIARAGLHFWEEPCISGDRGSGTVFFSGCPLKCRFCQNYPISEGNFGKEITTERLSEIFLELQADQAHNINLVNPTHYIPWVTDAIDRVRDRLHIPVVYNSGGYERVSSLKALEGYVDVYLPDLKYRSPYLSQRYSSAADYFDHASEALIEMYRQVGPISLDQAGIIRRGLIVRHLVLPGGVSDSIGAFTWLSRALPVDKVLVSVMSQYTPCHRTAEYPEINRRITAGEYEEVLEHVQALGFKGYFQDSSSAREEYTPPFDLAGV